MYKKTVLSILIIISAFIATAQANFLWAKGIGGISGDDSNSIAIDGSGNVYTTGYFSGTVDFDPGAGIYTLTTASQPGIFVSKLDATGNFVWAKNMGGSSSLGDIAHSITIDAANNIYITGEYYGTEDFDPSTGIYTLTSDQPSSPNAFVLKLDASGNLVWVKDFGETSSGVIGKCITFDSFGNIYTTGYFFGNPDMDPGPGLDILLGSSVEEDIFVSKLDASGNFVWAKSMGGTNINGDESFAIAVDALSNVYTTGYFTGTADFDPGAASYTFTSSGARDIFISKLDVSGNFIWAKQLGSTGTDYANSLALDVSGNVYTTGTFSGTVDFDPDAGVYNLTSTGGLSVFINKLTPSGNFIWAKNFGGTDITVDVNSNIYATGAFISTLDFDPNAGTFNLTSAGSTDAYISKLDASGNFVWAKQIGGTASDIGRSIAVDATGNVHITGYFNGTADFDPSASVYNLTSVGQTDIFVLKLDNAVGIEEFNSKDPDVNIYPNPSTGIVFIAPFSAIEGELDISIKDAIGRSIYNNRVKISDGKGLVDLDVKSGVYFMEIVDLKTERRINKKLIIQR